MNTSELLKRILILKCIILVFAACNKNSEPTISFSVPVLTTTEVTSITSSTASTGGNITSDGGADVTARGVCWSTNQNPTTTDNRTTHGTGEGNFTSTITGLTENTTYYIRAYATNSVGTGYGNEISFTTQQTGNVVEYFGQTPPGNIPVLFGSSDIHSNTQWFWHGSLDFSPTGNEFYMDVYYPNANPSGMRIKQKVFVNGVWSSIQTAPFAGDFVAAGMSFTNNGNTVYWISERPGGSIWTSSKNNGTWNTPVAINIPNPSGLGQGWRLSVANSGRIYMHLFSGGGSQCKIYTINYVNGNYSSPQMMSDSVNSGSFNINAFVDPDEEYIIFESVRNEGLGQSDLYISFRKPDNTWTRARNMGSAINSSSNEMAPGVSYDKQYLFFTSDRGGDQNPYWVSTGVIDNLKQGALNTDETVTDIDGNVYRTVKIGNQVWMAGNLKTTRYKDGMEIPNVTDDNTWYTMRTPGYCWYNNNISVKDTYGALYNWYAVNTGRLAPQGWHVPTKEEWNTLIENLGGQNEAGGRLKETGLQFWLSPNGGATNETGFSARGVGIRDNTFMMEGETTYIWSSTSDPVDNSQAFQVHLYWMYPWANLYSMAKYSGFSVRCIKD